MSGKAKTLCIVGVAVFIGSHLLEQVLRERIVIGIDLVGPAEIQPLLDVVGPLRVPPALPRDVGPLIGRCDVVINLAAICNPLEYLKKPVNTIHSNFTDALGCNLIDTFKDEKESEGCEFAHPKSRCLAVSLD